MEKGRTALQSSWPDLWKDSAGARTGKITEKDNRRKITIEMRENDGRRKEETIKL